MSIAGRISPIELRDLFLSLVALVIAFSLLVERRMPGLETILITAVGVSSGFLLHEMAHKFVALRFGYWAEYRANMMGLGLAIVMAFGGFLFAAPGAVMISKSNATQEFYMQDSFGQEEQMRAREKREMLLISLAGPMTNIVLAVFFFFCCLLADKQRSRKRSMDPGSQLRLLHQPHSGSLQYAALRTPGRQEDLRWQ